MKIIHITKSFWIIVLAISVVAAILTLLDKTDHLPQAWIAYAILLGLGAASIYGVYKAANASRSATSIALAAFGLRLVIGVALTLLLPIFGYQNNQEHQAGYVYTDAYVRDNQAWDLATSGKGISSAFSGEYSGDQYGGMLALSALVYRFLSPDAHRPFLIIILSAVANAWGVLCLWKATQDWFGEKTSLLATWFFALFPESILLGSSQMREAFVIPLTAITFYGITEILKRKTSGWLWVLLSAALLLLIQPLVGVISLAALLGVWLLDPLTLQAPRKKQTFLTIFLLVSLLLVAIFVASSILVKLPSLQGSGALSVYLTWFQNNFNFQSYQLEQSSGIFQSLQNSLGEQWRWLIILVYGIAQPVLPAVVGDPSAAWIMRIIGFLRAAGWYALVLFLVYGIWGFLRSRDTKRRFQLMWISAINWAWIMVSALNAGADQWDNPRYRAILLLWQVIMAVWAFEWARAIHDAWLWRWLAVEAVFVGLFTEWYLGRYYPGFIHLDIKIMTVIILVICGTILAGGLIWDRMHKRKPAASDSGL
jgi:Dolichyl-phosphate-mannose-protein mannosyltransferase